MTTPNQSIIERIKKVLALTSSPNEGEAAAAAEKVRQLLEQYDLTMDEIQTSNPAAAVDEISRESLEYTPEIYVKWRSSLAWTIGQHYGCEVLGSKRLYLDPKIKRTHIVPQVYFIGYPTSIAVCKAMFTWLETQLMGLKIKAWHEYVAATPGKTYRSGYNWERNFYLAAIKRISERMYIAKAETRIKQNRAESTKVDAIVVRHKESITTWIKDNMTVHDAKKTKFERSDDAQMAGLKAGSQVSIVEKHLSNAPSNQYLLEERVKH